MSFTKNMESTCFKEEDLYCDRQLSRVIDQLSIDRSVVSYLSTYSFKEVKRVRAKGQTQLQPRFR